MKTQTVFALIGAVAVAGATVIGATGCSKPAPAQTHDSKGALQFPPGRQPTPEEMARITAAMKKGQPATAASPTPTP